MYIGDIQHNKISIEINKAPIIYRPNFSKIMVREREGKVYLFVDDRRIEMNTLCAHKIGYTMALKVPKLSGDELITMKINGESFDMLKSIARKVSVALLRKADAADDYQLRRNIK